MAEGCAQEHVSQFEFTIAVRQPNHPLRPSDSSHVGFTEPEVWPNHQSQLDLWIKWWTQSQLGFELDDGLKVTLTFEKADVLRVTWTFESDDGPKITWALIKSIGLMQKMMDSESIWLMNKWWTFWTNR